MCLQKILALFIPFIDYIFYVKLTRSFNENVFNNLPPKK